MTFTMCTTVYTCNTAHVNLHAPERFHARRSSFDDSWSARDDFAFIIHCHDENRAARHRMHALGKLHFGIVALSVTRHSVTLNDGLPVTRLLWLSETRNQ